MFIGKNLSNAPLGNVNQGITGENYITFKYRNRHASINFNHDFLVHNGLRKGLNIG